MEQAPETPLKSGLYPPANAVLEVHVEVLVFFQDKYTHGKQQTRHTGEKELHQIPGTYLVQNIVGRTRNNDHSTWLMRSLGKGIKLNRRRPIEDMNGTQSPSKSRAIA